MQSLTLTLIAANIAIFLLESVGGSALTMQYALWPLGSGLFRPWQVVSYAFLHGNLAHLALNMYGLWLFGGELEQVWGPRRLLAFYTVSVLAAAASQLLVTAWMGASGPTIGASGGIFGLLAGFAMVFPHRTLLPLIPPIPMPAWVFVTLYGLVELSLGVFGTANGIAHFAHLGGLAGGWLVMRYWRSQPPFGGRRH